MTYSNEDVQLVKDIAKRMWELFPVSFIIGLVTRVILVETSILYLASIGRSSLLINIMMISWALTPAYFSIINTYYDFMGVRR